MVVMAVPSRDEYRVGLGSWLNATDEDIRRAYLSPTLTERPLSTRDLGCSAVLSLDGRWYVLYRPIVLSAFRLALQYASVEVG